MTGRAMALPDDVVTGSTEVCNARERLFYFVRHLAAQLHSLKGEVVDTQRIRDYEREKESI